MNKIAQLKNSTLLLVEDDEELCSSLKETLLIFFKTIIVAKDGKEALDLYNKQSVDVIITDYVMPRLDGNTLCKMLRETNRKIPLVIMSSYSDQEKLLKSIDLELSEYLIKPIEYNQLLRTLEKVAQKLSREHTLEFMIDEHTSYNFSTKEVHNKSEDKRIPLTKSEITIFELLIENLNKVVDLTQIEFSLSPNDSKSEQAIKNIIHRLRAKLSKECIQNVSGVGYILKKDIE